MKYIPYIVVAMLVFLTACQTSIEEPLPPMETPQEEIIPQETQESQEEASVQTQEPDHIFVLTGEDFAFFMGEEQNPQLRVQVGDLVRVEFTTTDAMLHDWVVDELGVATEIVPQGETTVVEFVADMPGEFEYYCSVGSHRERGMVGLFIVEE